MQLSQLVYCLHLQNAKEEGIKTKTLYLKNKQKLTKKSSKKKKKEEGKKERKKERKKKRFPKSAATVVVEYVAWEQAAQK